MRIVVLSFTIAVFLSIIALLQNYGQKNDQMKRRFNQVVDTERPYSDEELRKSFSERVIKPLIKRVSEGVRRSAGNRPVGQSKASIKIEKQLKASGLALTLQEFTFIKSMLILVFFVIASVFFFFFQ